MKDILEQQLSAFFGEQGMKKAIIGISGGVDSAVTFAMAVSALGKENVFPVLMPYKLGEVSSHQNFEDAKKLCTDWGVEYKVVHIDELALEYEVLFSGMAFANTLARIRMTLLFGYANQNNGLVLGTCNKSEVMLGYETKFGDGAADVSVIGDLWKSQVYELAKEYRLDSSFFNKAPSAELFVGHSDEEEMGFSYSEAEETLCKIEQGKTQFSTALERKIYDMYLKSEHKRIMPPILSLTA